MQEFKKIKEKLKDMLQSFFKPQYLELDKYIELTEEEYLSTNKDVVLEKNLSIYNRWNKKSKMILKKYKY